MSSLISLRDVLKGGYGIVKIDGESLELKSNDTFVSDERSSDCKDDLALLQTKPIRFADYFHALGKLDIVNGAIEPLSLKKIRPFLLSNEVKSGASTVVMKAKMSKGKKGKSGKIGSKKLNEGYGTTFTMSNPIPRMVGSTKDNRVYRITQDITINTAFSSSSTLTVFTSFNFQVNALDQISSLAAVFDQYRIDEVEFWIIPTLMGTGQTDNGLLYSVIDYDDSNALTTIGQCNDYTNVVVSPSGDGHYRRFRPHMAVAAYSGAFTSFTNHPSDWIDIASSSVQHYGVKTAVTVVTTIQNYNVQVRLHCSFRNIR